MASIACTPPAPVPGDAAALRERARGTLLGLAVGDALGAPAENLKPSEIRARWGRITGYVSEKPCGTDDTEYAIFSGLLLARHGSALTPAHVEGAWHQWIADRAEGPFRGAGFSERGTLENLRRGLAAPISAQHRHAWSDGLAMRAAPFGVFAAGRPGEAARLVAIDGSVSHEGEGIYGGQAVAAGVAAAMAGASPPVVIASALAVVPEDSWTARSLRRAVAVAHRGERAVRSAVVIGGYPWTDLAPEAVALAFGAYAAADGDFREAVLTAVNMGRDADTTAAVAGALSGATQGISAIPSQWASAIGPARGRCLPSMAGHHVLDVAELLVPEEGGKWGAGVVVPALLPEGARGITWVAATEVGETPAAQGSREPKTAEDGTPAAQGSREATARARRTPAAEAGRVATAEKSRTPAAEGATQATAETGPAPAAEARRVATAEKCRAHATEGAPAAAAERVRAVATEGARTATSEGAREAATDRTRTAAPAGTPPTSQPTEPPAPLPSTSQPTKPPAPLPSTSQPTKPPAPLPSTSQPTNPPAPLPSTSQPTKPPAPPAPTSPSIEPPSALPPTSQPTESGDGSGRRRGGRGRSSLVGAGNCGNADSEARP
ncbi:ADP-ribosylglycohydrolase family protein [Streptomyces sp. NPDC007905]|uniref:ADP-ribosylglycohydrolase family protein n=1 Tax=Streptomyces sp. NPDC007905 TaxID=3364788 RepID=UPI0036E4C7F9